MLPVPIRNTDQENRNRINRGWYTRISTRYRKRPILDRRTHDPDSALSTFPPASASQCLASARTQTSCPKPKPSPSLTAPRVQTHRARGARRPASGGRLPHKKMDRKGPFFVRAPVQGNYIERRFRLLGFAGLELPLPLVLTSMMPPWLCLALLRTLTLLRGAGALAARIGSPVSRR